MRRALWLPGFVLLVGLAALAVAAVRAERTGGKEGGPATAPDRESATAAVQAFLRLAAHLQGSGGDLRFAERIPAAGEVIDELVASAQFGRHLGQVEEPRLIRIVVRSANDAARGRIEVITREYWTTRVITADGKVREIRTDVLDARYLVVRDGPAWKVAYWTLGDGKPGRS